MPGAQQQPKGDEGSLDFLWMIVIGIAAIMIIWYFGKSHIAAVIYQFKLGEIVIIQYIVGFWDKIASVLHLPLPNINKLNSWATLIRLKEISPDINTVVKVNADVGAYVRYPVILALLFMMGKIYLKNVTLKFKKTFTMASLKEAEKNEWPKIAPTENLDLLNTDIEKGPWAMAMTPMQYCKRYKLLREVSKEGRTTAELITGKAYQVLSLQLGLEWHGKITKIPVYMQVLFAIFAAKACDNASKADELLDQISTSAATGQLDFSGYKPLLHKHIKNKAVVKVMQGHAYVLSMMASMVELARTAGVLASAEFLWLKAVDRKLWYMLNCVGRQTAIVEIAGIFSHWLAECRLKGAVKTPMVDEAVRGLKDSLEEVLYQPDEDEEE